MGQTSAVPAQTLGLIQHYYTGQRTKDLVFINLEFSFPNGTAEDEWTERLNEAIAPLVKYVNSYFSFSFRDIKAWITDGISGDVSSFLLPIQIQTMGTFMLNLMGSLLVKSSL